jgi:hypothetical protein
MLLYVATQSVVLCQRTNRYHALADEYLRLAYHGPYAVAIKSFNAITS